MAFHVKITKSKFIIKGDFIMEAIISYFSSHPTVLVIGIVLVIIFFLNFIFKSLFKLVLLVLVILFLTMGYYYFVAPEKVPDQIKETIETMKSGVEGFTEKGKSFYKDSKDLYKKGKNAPGDVNRLLKESEEEVSK
jgi:hypothetical protein